MRSACFFVFKVWHQRIIVLRGICYQLYKTQKPRNCICNNFPLFIALVVLWGHQTSMTCMNSLLVLNSWASQQQTPKVSSLNFQAHRNKKRPQGMNYTHSVSHVWLASIIWEDRLPELSFGLRFPRPALKASLDKPLTRRQTECCIRDAASLAYTGKACRTIICTTETYSGR